MELLLQVEQLQNELNTINDRIRAATKASKEDLDQRSVYIGNVDYNITPKELHDHMVQNGCTNINRVTILCNQNGTPKGFAYAEFDSEQYIEKALELTGLELNGRDIRVSVKRTNIPGMGRGRGRRPTRRGRGRRY